MLVGDIGRLAGLARDDALASAELALFHPLKFMLASPAEDADEILTRLGPEVWVEDKYDGIRAQLHKRGTDVRLYSRDLHDIGGQFPEIVEAARPLAWDGILDGEILAWKDGLVLPFIALQGRLGRKSPSDAIQADVPGHLRRLRCPGARAPKRMAPVRSSRCCGSTCAPVARGWTRWTCRGRGRRPVHPLAPGRRRGHGRAGGGVRRGPGPSQRGPDGQGPDQRLLARAGAAWAG